MLNSADRGSECFSTMGIVAAIWKAYDVDYDTVGDTIQNVKEGIVYPVAAGALFLIVAATVPGWWRPTLHEDLRLTSKVVEVIPVALLFGAAVNLIATKWDNVENEFLVWLAIGVLLVGFSEELLCRGLCWWVLVAAPFSSACCTA